MIKHGLAVLIANEKVTLKTAIKERRQRAATHISMR